MQFLMVSTASDGKPATPPSPEMYTEMGKFMDELTRSGALIATGGVDPHGTHIKSQNGQITVTDGPYTEAKEAIISYALIEAKSKEEAVEYSKRFWKIAGNGEGDIYQAFPPEQM